MKTSLLFIAIAFLSFNDMKAQDAKPKTETKTQQIVLKNNYAVQTELLKNNTWDYTLLKNKEVVFRSSESNLAPNTFVFEKDAISSAKLKADELDKLNSTKNK
jgi:hypothetical protein